MKRRRQFEKNSDNFSDGSLCIGRNRKGRMDGGSELEKRAKKKGNRNSVLFTLSPINIPCFSFFLSTFIAICYVPLALSGGAADGAVEGENGVTEK